MTYLVRHRFVFSLVVSIACGCGQSVDSDAQKTRITSLEGQVATLSERVFLIEKSGLFKEIGDHDVLVAQIRGLNRDQRDSIPGRVLMQRYLLEYGASDETSWILGEFVSSCIRSNAIGEGVTTIVRVADRLGWSFSLRRECGNLHLARYQFAEARDQFERMAELAASDVEVAETEYYAAYCLLEAGSMNSAVQAFDRFLGKWGEFNDIRVQSWVAGARQLKEKAEAWRGDSGK